MSTHVLKQGTQQWFHAREKKLTSSTYGTILGSNPWQDRESVRRLFQGEKTFFGNQSCRYGSVHEDIAIAEYEKVLKKTVTETGLWVSENPNVEEMFVYGRGTNQAVEHLRDVFLKKGMGGSPDGLVNENGIIEVKCPNRSVYPKELKATPYYMPQIQCNMFFTHTKWLHFICYTPLGMKVWYVPRIDTLTISPDEAIDSEIVGSEEELACWTRRGLYHENRFVGYWKVMVHLLFEFYQVCRQEKPVEWGRWEFNNSQFLSLINRLNLYSIKNASVIYSNRKSSPFSKIKRISWACMLAWQQKAREKYTLTNGEWVEFGVVPKNIEEDCLVVGTSKESETKPPGHCVTLGIQQEPSSTTDHILYVNLYTWSGKKRRGKRFEFDLNQPKSWTQKVFYMRHERKKTMPLTGIIFGTIEKNGMYTHGLCEEWKPKKLSDTLYEFPLFEGSLTFDNQKVTLQSH